jgi:hypothetical protein
MQENILIVGKNFLIQHLYKFGKCNIGTGTFKNIVEFSDMDNELKKKYIVEIVKKLKINGEIEIYRGLDGTASYILDLTSKTRTTMDELSDKKSTAEIIFPKKNKFLQSIQDNLWIFSSFIVSVVVAVVVVLTYIYK